MPIHLFRIQKNGNNIKITNKRIKLAKLGYIPLSNKLGYIPLSNKPRVQEIIKNMYY